MKKIDRRSFIKTSLITAASLGVLPGATGLVRRASAQSSANGDIRIAVVGFNGRGGEHIKNYTTLKGVRLVALCDVDKKVLDREVNALKKKNMDVAAFTDIRKLLESKDLDAISIATPNHWHSLAAIWGVEAGKDVYVEKPVCHNVWEGRQLVNAARKHDKIVQTGTQCRSSTGLAEAVAWVQAGNLGKIIRARGLCYKRRASIGKTSGPQPTPESVDYELWLGPAQSQPLRRTKLHYDWHWVWETGNGDLGNQGIHQMDIARWFLGENALSPQVFSFGGRLGYEDDGTTPNTLVTYHDYKAAPLIFEVRGLPEKTGTESMDKYHGAGVGVVVDCEGGSIVNPNYTKVDAFDKDGKKIKSWEGSVNHFDNFLKAVRSRKKADLHADILEGYYSSSLCHTGNISYRLGKEMSPNEMHEKIKGNADALESLGRMQEHLAANNVDLAKTPASFGEFLKFDTQKEKFTGNAKANQMLTREYRKGFEVKEIV